MNVRYARMIAGACMCAIVLPAAATAPLARAAAKPAEPAISPQAKAAIEQMGKSLSRSDASFEVHTIRVYQDRNGQLLHIFHTINVVVRRPNRLAVHTNGDDGKTDFFYDGKTVTILGITRTKYVIIHTPDNIDAMMRKVMGRLQVDFPLADLLTAAPGQAFLSGVTSGRQVNTATVDGVPCRHLFFSQKGGIELELWLTENSEALPRRLIVTYRSLPGEPNFIAEFSNWNFSARPSDAEFVFRAPAGAKQVALEPVASEPATKGDK